MANKNNAVSARAFRNKKARRANADKQKKKKATSGADVAKTISKAATAARRTGDETQQSYINDSKLKRNGKQAQKDNDIVVGRSKQQTKKQDKFQTRASIKDNEYGKKTNDNIKGLTKGNLRQIVASHARTLGVASENMDVQPRTSAGSIVNNKTSKQVAEANKKATNAKKAENPLSDWASKQLEKSAKEIEKQKADMSKAGKFAADVYGAGLGLATDAMAGPLAMGSMFSRSFGSAYDSAEKEGASKGQAMLYGASIGGVEAATERLFSVAKPLQKIYGKGAADDLTERVLNKMVGKHSGTGKGDLIFHGGKTFAAALTEGLEEMIAEGLEPTIANQIYADALGVHHETDPGQILHAGLVGGALGGILGGGGQVVEYSQGAQVRDVFGEEGIADMLKKAVESDDAADAVKATAMKAMVDNGDGIVAGQANQLKQAVDKQNARDTERLQLASDSAVKIMRDNKYIDIVQKVDEEGTLELAEHTKGVYEQTKEQATQAISENSDMQLQEQTADQITSAIASIRTGAVMDIDAVNMFTLNNPEARAVYETVTGEALPKTNAETRDYLYHKIAENKVNSAEAETNYFVDRLRGVLEQDIATTYDAKGQEAFSDVIAHINPANAGQVQASIVTFEDYYEAGRRGESLEFMNSLDNPVYNALPAEVRKAAYEAGSMDQNASVASAKGVALQLGQKAELNRSQTKPGGQRGKVTSRLSKENRSRFTAQQQIMYRKLAQVFNINIEITDDPNMNGFYDNGTITLSVNADRDLAYVFAHEITHHMELYAPEEYLRFKDLVRSSWDYDGLNGAIDAKIRHYADNGVKLSREGALDEILADSTYEMIQDENFVEELCREDRSMAQAILDALKALIKKLRAVLVDGDKFTPVQNAGLLSQLDILKDAEKLWVDGLMKAAENSDAVSAVEATGAVKYQLKPYTEKQRENWENSNIIIYENEAQLIQFIEDAKKGLLGKKKMYFGIVPDNLAKDVMDKTGIDITNRNITLGAYEVIKIFKDHGNDAKEELRGQRAVEISDFKNIVSIIESPDKIKLEDKMYNGRPILSFEKEVDGKVTVVTYDSAKHMDLRVQTMFAHKKRSLATATDDQASVNTSETTSGTAPVNIISKSPENGNKKFSLKDQQFDIIQNTNPMQDDYHTGIRSTDDILTFEEALQDSDYEGWEEDGFDPDYDGETAKQALKTGRITVFSSYPIENGVFVTPSRMEAESYSGTGDVHEMNVALEDVAWIDPTQGQYAKVKYSFAGNSALTVDTQLLKRAQEMSRQDTDSETIRKETGWFKGYDGMWRFEIDDSEFSIDMSALSDECRLGDVIKHPKLFEAYPTLEDVKVNYVEILSGQLGTYFPDTDEIYIDSSRERTEKMIKSVLIHELQHAIQYREDFASGASVSFWEKAVLNGYDSRPESIQKEEQELLFEYGKLVDENREFALDMIALERMLPDMPRGKIDWETFEQIEEDPIEWQEYDKRRDEIEAQYGEEKVWDFIALTHRMDALKEKGRSASKLYYDTAGEIEARDAEWRLDYSEAERRDRRPDIDYKGVVFAERAYSFKDSTGRELSQQQAEFFKDSKVRDENGNLLVMYHGTDSYEDFNVFKSGKAGYLGKGMYFSDSESYAKRYAAKNGYDGRIYETYLNVKNPLVVTSENPAVEILGEKLAARREKNNSFSTTWIKPSDIKKLVDKGYDGIIWKYGPTIEVSVWNPNQIKNIDNSKPTTDPDIRYSFKDDIDEDAVNNYVNEHPEDFSDSIPYWEYERDAARVKDQTIGELRNQVARMKLDKLLTHGRVLDTSSVKEEVNSLVRMLMTSAEGTTAKTNLKLVDQITENVQGIYRTLKAGNEEDAIIDAYNLAEDIVENLQLVNDEMFHTYKDLRDYLRTTKVYISEEDKSNIPDFKDFRRRNMGRLLIVNEGNGGTSIDNMYMELCQMYPGMFDTELTHPADQLQEIADVRETLEPYDIMLTNEETEQLIKETAHDLIEIAANGKPWVSWADRQREAYEGKVEALKQKHKEAIRDIKRKEKDRYETKLDAQKAKADERVQKVKEKGEEKLQAEKDKNKQQRQDQREERKKKELIRKMEKNIQWLSDRLLKPTDDKHLPEGYQRAIAQLLYAIDTQTARSKQLEEKYGLSQKKLKLLALKEEYKKIAENSDSGIILDEEIEGNLTELGTLLDDYTISDASAEQVEMIYKVLRNIVHGIQHINKAFNERLKENYDELANETIFVAEHKKKHHDRSGLLGGLDTLLNESMVTPRDFFMRIGGGLNKTFLQIRKGMDDHVDNLTVTRDFFDQLFEPYRKKTQIRKRNKPGSIVEDWRDSSTNEEFELESGGTIKLNVAQRMSLYCLMKRDQAVGHIMGSGIVASEVDAKSKIKQWAGAKKEVNSITSRVTWPDVEKIIGSLTQEQVEMADKLMGFLNNECAAWGNKASMRLFGYEKFTEENYFPIQSADVYLDSKFEGRTSVERIRNFGFTKGTVTNANNPIVIDDIFSVVADHVNKMSMYSAFAVPIADFTRVYNYKTRNEDGTLDKSVQAVLTNAFGERVDRYVNNFMADLQSNTQMRTEGFTRLMNKTLANYKKATIGMNIRVALQQPTAIMRTFIMLDPKYFLNGDINVAKNLADMKEHCQIARWKSWGHNQVDMARDIDEIMMNREFTRFDYLSMGIYGSLDNVTWSVIWAAVRKEVQAKHPHVTVDSEEFYDLCNERASEIYDRTQVVDSVMHRSQVMRNTDTMSKVLTSFMAEPTRTFNMIRSEFAAALDMARDGDKARAGKKVAKAATIYLMNAFACAAAAAVADALRGKDLDDDDEPEKWFEHTLKNFITNANPLNLLPVAKEISSIWNGWGTQNMALEGMASFIESAKAFTEKATGNNDDSWETVLMDLGEGFGLMFGIPIKNMRRDIKALAGLLGIEVSAATVEDEPAEEKEKLIDRAFDGMGIKDGSNIDKTLNFFGLNRTDAEQAAYERERTVKALNKQTKNMSDKERADHVWSEVMSDYTKDLETGNIQAIIERRKILEAAGGDVDKFDKNVLGETKTAFKKTIGDPDKAEAAAVLRDYLKTEYGYTDAKISNELLTKTETAKEFQLALCTNDQATAISTLYDLVEAGLTYEDYCALYLGRASAIQVSDYSTGEFNAPVTGTVTSTFGYRDAPTAGASTYHQGIDIAAPEGTIVGAADGGKVSSVGYSKTKGNYVTIYHGNGRYTEYLHLWGYNVQKGDAVLPGQEIGKVGSTGVSTGPHLHFAVKESETYVDPAGYLGL